MDEFTLKVLNNLQKEKISLRKACKLLNKSKKEIRDLFDSESYVYLPTVEDVKN